MCTWEWGGGEVGWVGCGWWGVHDDDNAQTHYLRAHTCTPHRPPTPPNYNKHHTHNTHTHSPQATQDSAVSVHPGLVDTALARGYFCNLIPTLLQPLLNPLFPVILRTPASAAKTVVYAATAPEVAGQYVSDGRVHTPSKLAQRVDVACRLWDVSQVLVGWEAPDGLAPH